MVPVRAGRWALPRSGVHPRRPVDEYELTQVPELIFGVQRLGPLFYVGIATHSDPCVLSTINA